MKKRHTLLAVLALVLAAATVLTAALAYFTANTRASGGRTLQLGGKTEIKEEMDGWTKSIQISCDPVSQPMYVRARAFSTAENIDSENIAAHTLAYSGANWTDGGDGWYYYNIPLANLGGEKPVPDGMTSQTEQLDISIAPPKTAPAGKENEEFDVVVVYETAPVQYNADGTPLGNTDPVIWNTQLIPKGGDAE